MRCLRSGAPVILALLVRALVWSESAGPRFEDYPVAGAYAGAPAALRLDRPLAQEYAAEIRDGMTDAYRRTNFAGHLIVAKWGCGAPCLRMAIVDAQTGEIYYPPITFEGVGSPSFDLPLLTLPGGVSQNPEIDFRSDSNLMIIKATPSQAGKHSSYAFYFLWRGNGWSLLRKVPLVAR